MAFTRPLNRLAAMELRIARGEAFLRIPETQDHRKDAKSGGTQEDSCLVGAAGENEVGELEFVFEL
jgi:hypothetical protein